MKRRLAVGGIAAILFAASSAAQENHKLKGRVNIVNRCSKDPVPEVRVSISVEFTGEGTGRREVEEKPDKPFVVDFPKVPAIKSWKIADVRRMDKTPICSCIAAIRSRTKTPKR